MSKEHDLSTFGGRLAYALELSKKDRKALATALNTTVQAVGQVINGDTKSMTAENAARAARFMEVSGFWLATGDGEPQKAKPGMGATLFRSLDTFEAMLITLFRKLPTDDERQHALIDLNQRLDAATSIASSQTWSGKNRRGPPIPGYEPERRRSDTLVSDTPMASPVSKTFRR